MTLYIDMCKCLVETPNIIFTSNLQGIVHFINLLRVKFLTKRNIKHKKRQCVGENRYVCARVRECAQRGQRLPCYIPIIRGDVGHTKYLNTPQC